MSNGMSQEATEESMTKPASEKEATPAATMEGTPAVLEAAPVEEVASAVVEDAPATSARNSVQEKHAAPVVRTVAAAGGAAADGAAAQPLADDTAAPAAALLKRRLLKTSTTTSATESIVSRDVASERAAQGAALEARLVALGFPPDLVQAAHKRSSSEGGCLAWLLVEYEKQGLPWPAGVARPQARPAKRIALGIAQPRRGGTQPRRGNPQTLERNGCACDACPHPTLLALALCCPALASAIYEGDEDHWSDEQRPGYECIMPAIVLCAQLFCCHIGGVVLACVSMNREDED
jgi:hypothetical protein